MIRICPYGCNLPIKGPADGVDITAAEVESMRVWHFYEEHPLAWRYLTVVLAVPRGATTDVAVPGPTKQYHPRPARLPRLEQLAS